MYDRTNTIEDFLAACAARQPAPASGSITAVAGALSAAMGEMVINYSIGKKGLESFDPVHRQALSELHRARQLLLGLMVEDQAAFEAYSALRKLPEDSPRRAEQFGPTLLACIRIPQAMAATAVAILEVCDRLVDSVNPYLLCDLAVCADLAMATVRCAMHNIRVNLKEVADEADRRSIEEKTGRLFNHALTLIQKAAPRIWQRDSQGP